MSSDKTDADIAFIRALAEILNENDLGEIEVSREFGEDDELSVRLARGGTATPAQPQPAPIQQAPAAQPPAFAAPAHPPAEDPTPAANPDQTVPSPMVGTVYLAPEPDAAPFVSVGDTVSKGQTILIVEAMKTMNQIPSPRSGVIKEILVHDAEPVEYGSPLMTIV